MSPSLIIIGYILLYSPTFTQSMDISSNHCNEFNISFDDNNNIKMNLNGIYTVQQNANNNNIDSSILYLTKHIDNDKTHRIIHVFICYESLELISIVIIEKQHIILSEYSKINNNNSIKLNIFSCINFVKNRNDVNDVNINKNVLLFDIDNEIWEYITDPIATSNILITYILSAIIISLICICSCCIWFQCRNNSGCCCCYDPCRCCRRLCKYNNNNNIKREKKDHIMTPRHAHHSDIYPNNKRVDRHMINVNISNMNDQKYDEFHHGIHSASDISEWYDPNPNSNDNGAVKSPTYHHNNNEHKKPPSIISDNTYITATTIQNHTVPLSTDNTQNTNTMNSINSYHHHNDIQQVNIANNNMNNMISPHFLNIKPWSTDQGNIDNNNNNNNLSIEMQEKPKLSDLHKNSNSLSNMSRKHSTMTGVSDGSSIFGVGVDIDTNIPIQNPYHQELYSQYQRNSGNYEIKTEVLREDDDDDDDDDDDKDNDDEKVEQLSKDNNILSMIGKETPNGYDRKKSNFLEISPKSHRQIYIGSVASSHWSELSEKTNINKNDLNFKSPTMSTQHSILSESSTFTQDISSKDIAKYTGIPLEQYYGNNNNDKKRKTMPIKATLTNKSMPNRSLPINRNHYISKPLPPNKPISKSFNNNNNNNPSTNLSPNIGSRMVSSSSSSAASSVSSSQFVPIQAVIGSITQNDVEFVQSQYNNHKYHD